MKLLREKNLTEHLEWAGKKRLARVAQRKMGGVTKLSFSRRVDWSRVLTRRTIFPFNWQIIMFWESLMGPK